MLNRRVCAIIDYSEVKDFIAHVLGVDKDFADELITLAVSIYIEALYACPGNPYVYYVEHIGDVVDEAMVRSLPRFYDESHAYRDERFYKLAHWLYPLLPSRWIFENHPVLSEIEEPGDIVFGIHRSDLYIEVDEVGNE